jgi:hypothetical protein
LVFDIIICVVDFKYLLHRVFEIYVLLLGAIEQKSLFCWTKRFYPSCALLLIYFHTAVPSNEYTSMSPAEQTAFGLVAQYCRADVETKCSIAKPPPKATSSATVEERSLSVPKSTMTSTGQHPLITFHRHPLDDFDSFLDHFLQPPPMFLMPDMTMMSDARPPSGMIWMVQENPAGQQHPSTSRITLTLRGGGGGGSGPQQRPPCPFDTMMRQVVSNVPPRDFSAVAQKMNEKASAILADASSSQHGRVIASEETTPLFATARRLQEVTPDTLREYRRAFLPFAPDDNRCLENAYQAYTGLSKSCIQAISDLYAIRGQEQSRSQEQALELRSLITNYVHLWVWVLGVLVLLAISRRGERQRHLRLGDRIFTAVYSRPALKRAVEAELGHSVGSVPPVPLHRNLMRGKLRASFIRVARFVACLRVWILLATVVVACYSPLLALQLAVWMTAFCFGMLFYTVVMARPPPPPHSDNPEHVMCVCCNCGLSTQTAASLDSKTAVQCPCCAGTGVCSVHCGSCGHYGVDKLCSDRGGCPVEAPAKQPVVKQRRTVLSPVEDDVESVVIRIV